MLIDSCRGKAGKEELECNDNLGSFKSNSDLTQCSSDASIVANGLDCYYIQATLPGYIAVGSDKYGSHFTFYFCQVIEEFPDEDIRDVVAMARARVVAMMAQNEKKLAQIAVDSSMLVKVMRLKPRGIQDV